MKTEKKIVILSTAAGPFIWLIYAVLDYVAFYEGSFWGLLIADVPPYAIYSRSVAIACVLGFGLATSVVLAQRRRPEQALRESEERFRLLVSTAFDGINISEHDLVTGKRRLIFCNDRYVEMSGYTREELEAADDLDQFIQADMTEEEIGSIHKAYERGAPVRGVASWIRPDGKQNTYEFSALAMKVGDRYHVFGFDRDITERRKAEEALRQSEARFRLLAETAFDGISICEWDLAADKRRLIFCNDRFVEMSGYGREELERADDLNDLVVSLSPEEEAAQWRDRRLKGLPTRGIASWKRPDGKDNIHEWSAVCVKVGERYHIIGFDRDITERRKAEEALRASEERFRLIVETVFDGISISEFDPITHKRRLIFCNDRYVEMSGYTREELENADDLAQLADTDMTEEEHEVLFKAIERGEPNRGRARWNRPDGKQNTYEWSSIAVNVGGKDHIFGVDRDVTEQRRAQQQLREYAERLQFLNAELQRSNRDLQEFTYAVSHDLREPLRKVHTFGEFLLEDCGEQLSEEGRQHLRRMQDAAVRMKDLIQHLLALARVGARGAELALVEPRQVIEEALENLSESIRECGAEVVVQQEVPTVMADAVQLGQVFQNLVGNSLKFRSPERAPKVTISARVDRDQATFSVADNGIGIEERFLDKIFGVFQRLHPRDQYEGAGVGLALCEKIVRRHGGRIWVESAPGKGSTFRFTLNTVPVAKEQGL